LTAELELVRNAPATRSAAPLPAAVQTGAPRQAFRPSFDDHFRLTLTPLQSGLVTIAITALVVGALGMAASGWVAAHHWSCRTGLMTSYCAPAPAPKPFALPEIPT
jgi:hypothetical protein